MNQQKHNFKINYRAPLHTWRTEDLQEELTHVGGKRQKDIECELAWRQHEQWCETPEGRNWKASDCR